MAVCCICFASLKSNNPITSTECGHVFHDNCLSTWFNSNTSNHTCPNCRRKIHSSSLRRLHLDFSEDIHNNSLAEDLQYLTSQMSNKLEGMERKILNIEKKYTTTLKSRNFYQQRASQWKKDVSELKAVIKDLNQTLGEERKQRQFYETECIALSTQIDEIQNNW